MENIYKIPVCYINKFEKKIEKLNKKAKKLNVEPIIMDILGTEIELRDDGYEIPCYKVKVSQEREIKIEGYEFVGKLEQNLGDTFLYKGDDIVPKAQKEVRICQHCNSKRKRKLLYILKDSNDNFITVGKSCLIDYIGHQDAEKIAKYYYEVMTFITSDDLLLHQDEDYYIGSIEPTIFSIDQILRTAIVSINDRGYYKSDCECGRSTKDDVYAIIFPKSERERELKEKADNISKDEIDKIKQIILDMEPVSSYIENLQLIINDGFTAYNFLGYAVSIIPTVNKHLEKAKKKEFDKNSDYIGIVGEKIDLLVTFYRYAFYDRISNYTGQYEKVNIYTFIDEEGNHIVWKTTSSENFDIGDKINIKGKVKEHNEYNGLKQTLVTRPTCKFVNGNYKSKFLKELGEDLEVEVVCVKSDKIEIADSMIKYRYEFLDKKQNSIVFESKKDESIKLDSKLKLSGRVSEHSKYKGTKQTILRKVSFQAI